MTAANPPHIGVQQRVLASYRIPFFDALAITCPGGLSVFAGEPRADENIESGARPLVANFTQGRNYHLFSGQLYLCWQAGLMRWLQRRQPDVLIMEANPRYLLSRRTMHWIHARSGKVIGWGLGSPAPVGHLSRPRLVLRRRFVQQFDALITYSQTGAEEYHQLGYPLEKIFTAPNAVAPKPAHPLPDRPANYKTNRPAVLFVGRLQARKKVDRLIEACSLLPPSVQPRLWIVGDGPLRHQLENLASQSYPQTRFFGAQHGEELGNLMRKADLFVLPGTGGLAIQQAMSFGLPVIAGQADGTQSDLVRPENGWTLSDDSPQELSRRIQEALGDTRRLRRMGAAAYRIVSQEINLENMVAVFQRAIQSVRENA